ncbi:hypothetical protein [Actinoallomurus iriomotensis]|uniref:Uncharacterized protein n=1 Tax=Actinoallomurus iriomotensis TaxID=478107 RepID=A0A9W6RDG5_9ACTN|nr:hypothetical protein [Actinoallomurus iriomotensis]GLY73788.1 hypothetical protein Airi01_020550 [Actinoallomurus iriomotensis]
MAERLTAASDLKKAFAEFDDMSRLIDDMRLKADEINKYNKESAGDDDVGKQYKSTVDTPTKNLTELLATVRTRVDQVGVTGQDTSDQFQNADENGKDLTNGM